MINDLNKVRLTDEQWDNVYSVIEEIGLAYEDLNDDVGQKILANRIKEVTGKEVKQLVKEQEDK